MLWRVYQNKKQLIFLKYLKLTKIQFLENQFNK